MKSFVGYIANKIVKATPRSKKVAPDIKSIKPTKDIKGSVKRVKSKEYSKRVDKVLASKDKIDTGKKMMREGQKELKKMVDTKRAFKFKYGTTRQKTFPIEPGKNPKKEFKNLVEEKPTKKFKTAKELEQQEYFKYKKRDKKMGGGMAGRRMGYAMGESVKPAAKKIKKLMDESKAKKQDAARVKFDAKKSDLDKSGDLSKYEKRRGMAIAKAMSKRNKKII